MEKHRICVDRFIQVLGELALYLFSDCIFLGLNEALKEHAYGEVNVITSHVFTEGHLCGGFGHTEDGFDVTNCDSKAAIEG